MELFLIVDTVNKINRLLEGDIEIGTVEAVGTNDQAYAELDGQYPNWTLNLGLPRGLQGEASTVPGPKGDQGEKGDKGDTGDPSYVPGPQGNQGWAPMLAVVSDGNRRVLQIWDWTGGAGPKPSTTNQFIGPTGIVGDAASAVDVRGSQGLQGIQGIQGNQGNTGSQGNAGWTPVMAVVSDGTRRVLQITDWVGGAGTKPSTTNQFVGPTGIVSSAASAVDVRGDQGIQGIQGIQGDKGWAPILAAVSDGARRVHQIVDWTGGAGTKPSTTNQFIGPTGIVGSAAAAVDIRGAAGADGTNGTTGTNGTNGTNAASKFTSTTSRSIGTGSKQFDHSALSQALPVGSVVRVQSDAAPTTNYMVGVVTASTTISTTINVTQIFGSGTKTDWTGTISGFSGAANVLFGAVGSLPGPYPDGYITGEY